MERSAVRLAFSNACFAAASCSETPRHKVQQLQGLAETNRRQGKRTHILGIPVEDDKISTALLVRKAAAIRLPHGSQTATRDTR